MSLGPIEMFVVGFPDNGFNGEIAPALSDLVEAGTIRIVDLLFIAKDGDGTVASFEINELDDDISVPTTRSPTRCTTSSARRTSRTLEPGRRSRCSWSSTCGLPSPTPS
jgi:hypothetical protein